MSSPPEIIVYYWKGSPWASKVTTYLAMRGIPYTANIQPITMPRPDLAALGVNYRRVPVVSIGKDVYVDSLLIIQKLEALFPSAGTRGSLSGKGPEQKAMEKLLEKWTDAVVFGKAADCIPVDHPLVTDPKFIEDRSQLWGESWDPKHRLSKRPEGLANMREMFDFVEHTLLEDDRQWVLGTKEPGLADIHTAWIFNWMLSLDGSFPDSIVNKEIYPKTLAYCARYQKAVDDATAAAPVPEEIDGAEVLKRIAAAPFAENPHGVDSKDPIQLKEGQEVTMGPTDTGFTAMEKGPLVAIIASEIVVESKTKDGTKIHVHAPRWNFRVRAA